MPLLSRRRALQTLFCSSAALALNLRNDADAAVQREALHLLAIGDFGTGGADQKRVAEAMRQFVAAKKLRPAGLWLLGDNVYGPTPEGFSVRSKRWQEEIEAMYPAAVFPGPQWAVLGNHDYHDNAGGEQVQLAYARQPGVRWHLPDKWYRVDLGGPKPLVTFIALDSNLPEVSGGYDKKKKRQRTSLSAAEAERQQAWLKSQLAGPRAPFTVVVAHHPLYSNGSHGDSPHLQKLWGGLLQEHRVHAYLCGHDHDLQHLELEGLFTSFVLSGGGGGRIRALKNARTMPYGRDLHGFTHLQIEPEALTFSHHGVDGRVLHRFTKRPDGRVEY